VFQYAITAYSEHLTETNATEVDDNNIEQFRGFLVEVINSDPRFYDATQGLEIQKDAKFLAFTDENANGIKDGSDTDIYTVEIDEENNRLIATDMSGNASGLRFSGTGLVAGLLLGSLLSRQRAAGVSKSSFSNRNATPRSSYKAPRSSRSGGLRSGK